MPGTLKMPRYKKGPRDRVDLRVDPKWIEDVKKEADYLNMGLSNYIRYCVSKQMERDRNEREQLRKR